MTTTTAPLVIKFCYQGEVYRITIEELGERYVAPKRKPWVSKTARRNMPLITSQCPVCNGIVVVGICTNKKCDTNIEPKLDS